MPQSQETSPESVIRPILDFIANSRTAGVTLSPETENTLVDKYFSLKQAQIDRGASSRSIWYTPLAVALTGLITLSGNFLFDYIKAGAVATNSALTAQREFQYKILQQELAENKTEQERAKVLLFLVRAGVLDQLNRIEIEKMALSVLPPDDNLIGIPSLSSKSVKDYLNSIGESDIAEHISNPAIDLIVKYEGVPEASYKGRPHTGTGSGVIIGFWYDLGQASASQFQEDWGDLLDPNISKYLNGAIGLTGDEAQQFVNSAPDDIIVSYEAAKKEFIRTTIVRYANQLLEKIPQSARLSANCFGAMVVLGVSRGFAFDREGDSYSEMRAIKSAIERGDERAIPDLLRSMKRLFGPFPGLQLRRELEAKLCESPAKG